MKYLFFILFFAAFGCQSVEKPKKPDNLISEEKMIEIMMESYISNAARSVNNRKIRSYGLKLDSVIYAKYNVDSTQVSNSNNYYAANLEDYESMFQIIDERLKALKKEADSIQKLEEANKSEEEKVKDSVSEQSGLVPALQASSQDSIE
ncbi:DUF4296 domain-containing protein [Marixanthomonas ophiurae]|uniref:DUF4296 domain-containing protein n=1 Tax=Marixanthomonas ophiurae TaxID=387659 RepID=A0A3E1QB83_9FLAO|nr:DUF4296 domain-containing protein [Marixanthomonas ophiurae]RFN59395.1 DUF4296 domain-containing protein [Marixanthomonas ophiurae]